MTFGQRLKLAREGKKLTQKQLGEGLGTDGKNCTKAVVSGWEQDKHMPRADQLALICTKLDASADQLLFGKVAGLGLLPEVAELAQTINALPEPQRIYVLRQSKVTIDYLPNLFRPVADEPAPPDLKQEPSAERAKKLM